MEHPIRSRKSRYTVADEVVAARRSIGEPPPTHCQASQPRSRSLAIQPNSALPFPSGQLERRYQRLRSVRFPFQTRSTNCGATPASLRDLKAVESPRVRRSASAWRMAASVFRSVRSRISILVLCNTSGVSYRCRTRQCSRIRTSAVRCHSVDWLSYVRSLVSDIAHRTIHFKPVE